MIKQETLSDLLFEEMNLHPNGEKTIKSKYNDWPIEIFAEWNSRVVKLTIAAKVPKFHILFQNCTIRQAKLMSLIARYDNYSLIGKSSPISDLLLSNPIAKNLLKGKNARFELADKNLIYNVRLKRRDKTSLSNVLTLIEKLTEKINLIA